MESNKEHESFTAFLIYVSRIHTVAINSDMTQHHSSFGSINLGLSMTTSPEEVAACQDAVAEAANVVFPAREERKAWMSESGFQVSSEC